MALKHTTATENARLQKHRYLLHVGRRIHVTCRTDTCYT